MSKGLVIASILLVLSLCSACSAPRWHVGFHDPGSMNIYRKHVGSIYIADVTTGEHDRDEDTWHPASARLLREQVEKTLREAGFQLVKNRQDDSANLYVCLIDHSSKTSTLIGAEYTKLVPLREAWPEWWEQHKDKFDPDIRVRTSEYEVRDDPYRELLVSLRFHGMKLWGGSLEWGAGENYPDTAEQALEYIASRLPQPTKPLNSLSQ